MKINEKNLEELMYEYENLDEITSYYAQQLSAYAKACALSGDDLDHMSLHFFKEQKDRIEKSKAKIISLGLKLSKNFKDQK